MDRADRIMTAMQVFAGVVALASVIVLVYAADKDVVMWFAYVGLTSFVVALVLSLTKFVRQPG